MLLLTLTHDADAQLHIFKVVAGDAEGDSGDAGDLGEGSERVDESHSSCEPPRYHLHASAPFQECQQHYRCGQTSSACFGSALRRYKRRRRLRSNNSRRIARISSVSWKRCALA